MSGREVGAGSGPSRLVAVTVVATIGLGLLAFTLSAGADVGAVSGSAYGASGTVSVDGGAPAVLEPTPTVTLPSSGGRVTNTGQSTAFGPEGAYLTTGTLTVTSEGTTGTGGSSYTTASVDTVDAMGYLTASNVTSYCTASETGLQAWTAISPDATLMLDPDRTIPLIANPHPNETHHGTNGSGERYTVILNEQTYDESSNTITATAVHLILEGPRTVGDIYIGQSHCDVTVVASTTSTMPWSSVPSSTSTSTSTSSTSSTSTSSSTSSSTSTSTSTSSSTTTTVVPASGCSSGHGPVRRPLPPAADGPAAPRCPGATG